MKIAWFTPFSKESAIGKYSRAVTDALAERCEVDLWLSETKDLLSTKARVVHYDPAEDMAKRLAGYDLAVYNMGNYLPFHLPIYETSRKVRGVVILHDFVLHHFFAGYFLVHKKDAEGYVMNMGNLYGAEGIRAAEEYLKGRTKPVWDTDDVVKYPFFEKAISGALGVVAHSRFLAEKVEKGFLGPVKPIYFPFYSDADEIVSRRITKDDVGIPGDKVLMLTVGHVNKNKRVDKVIKVIGESPDLSGKVIYLIIGQPADERYFPELQSLVDRYGLKDTVRFLGFQPEETLRDYMAAADIFVNLRYPAMEGASWSLVEEMYFGKPSLVTDTGFYTELPSGFLRKIRMEKEEEDIKSALKQLVHDGGLREETGRRAREFAVQNFNTGRYCKDFFDFVDRVRSCRPVIELVDTISFELSSMGVHENMEVVDKVANEVHRMVNG